MKWQQGLTQNKRGKWDWRVLREQSPRWIDLYRECEKPVRFFLYKTEPYGRLRITFDSETDALMAIVKYGKG